MVRCINANGAIACCFSAIKYLKENGLHPKYKTVFQFPYSEELGMGAAYIPEDVSEVISIDIGLVGPELDGNEFAVSICAKDALQIYDYDITTRLVEYAKRRNATMRSTFISAMEATFARRFWQETTSRADCSAWRFTEATEWSVRTSTVF